jgi:Rad3-related DNA helicase
MYDDLNTEDAIDILLNKGLLTEGDIDEYIINAAEDHIWEEEIARQETEEDRRQEAMEHAQLLEKKKLKKEKELKEISRDATQILKNNHIYKLAQFGGTVWIGIAIFSIPFVSGYFIWVVGMLFWGVFTMGSDKYFSESSERVELAKEHLTINDLNDKKESE